MKGPPAEAIESYRSTMNCNIAKSEEQEYISFTELKFEELCPK